MKKRTVLLLAGFITVRGIFGATFPTEFVAEADLPSSNPVMAVFPSDGCVIVVQENGSELIGGSFLSTAPGVFSRVFPDGHVQTAGGITAPVNIFSLVELSPDQGKIITLAWRGDESHLSVISAGTLSQSKAPLVWTAGKQDSLVPLNDRCFIRYGNPKHGSFRFSDYTLTIARPFSSNGTPDYIEGSGLGLAFCPVGSGGRLVYAAEVDGPNHSHLIMTNPYDLTIIQRDILGIFPYSPLRDIYYVTGHSNWLHVFSSEGVHKIDLKLVAAEYKLFLDWEITGAGVKPNSHLRPVIEGENSVVFLGQGSGGNWTLYRATSGTIPAIVGSPLTIPDSEVSVGKKFTMLTESYWYPYSKELRYTPRGWFYFASVYPGGSAVHAFSDDLTSHSVLFEGRGLAHSCVVGEYGYFATTEDGPKKIEIYRAWAEPEPEITVISPNGGESWPAGSTQQIKWGSIGAVGDVAILYSTDRGAGWTPVFTSTQNDGAENWIVPNTPSNQCLLKVAAVSSPTVVFDESDSVFTITPASSLKTLTLIWPNGGENFCGGVKETIVWTSTGDIQNVALEYSIDGGSNWTTIKSLTPNDGLEEWIVPSTSSTSCLVKIRDILDPTVYDVSDNSFSIRVVKPAGAGKWRLYSVLFEGSRPEFAELRE